MTTIPAMLPPVGARPLSQETALRDSKRFLRSTLDALSAHLAILDEHGTIIKVNAAWNRFAGENEFIGGHLGVGDNYLKICDSARGDSSEGAAAVAVGIRAVMAGQKGEFSFEYPCHSPSEQRWFVVRVTRFDGNGSVHVVVAHENITSRKQAEEATRQVERSLAQAMSLARLVGWEYDVASGFFTFSDRYFALHGTTSEREGGNVMSAEHFAREFMHPDDAHFVAEEVTNAVAAADPDYRSNLEVRILCRDGATRHVLVHISVTKDASGRTIQLRGANQDITERKQSEQSLRNLWRAVEQTPATVVITNVSGKIEYVNPKFVEITGYSVAEALGQNPRILKSGLHAAGFYKDMWDTLLQGKVWQGEMHNKKKNGDLYWESASVSPVRDPEGEITHFIAVKEDITERKRAAEALHRAQKKLEESDLRQKTILNNIPDAVWLRNREGRYLAVNEAWCEFFGLDESEAIGKTERELLPPAVASRFLEHDSLIMSSCKPLRFEEKLVRGMEGVSWFEVFLSPLLDESGQFCGAAGSARDITQRKQAEDALKEQLALRERLAKIAANVPGIIYSFLLRPDGSACIPYASPTIEEFCGARATEVEHDASSLFNLIHPDDLARVQKSIANSARTLLPWRGEFQVRHPKKGVFWVEAQSTPELQADGSVLWHGFISDITERRRAAQQLAEHEEREVRSRRALEHEREMHQIKSRFVSMVSHEFRTPLCVIGMAASLLDGYSEQMTGEERTEQNKEIQRAVKRMTQMMEDFLVHGEIESGRMEYKPARVDVQALCQRLISEVSILPGAAYSVTLAIAPAAREAFIDEKIVGHILGNLLSNAVKYSLEGQSVTLEVRHVAGPAQPSGGTKAAAEDHLELKVSDSGIGIPAADLARLYQAFHRASNIGNRPGTGMGLAIVKQCVDLHRGTIRVESLEGKGTTVWVCLPVPSPEVAGTPIIRELELADFSTQ